MSAKSQKSGLEIKKKSNWVKETRPKRLRCLYQKL